MNNSSLTTSSSQSTQHFLSSYRSAVATILLSILLLLPGIASSQSMSSLALDGYDVVSYFKNTSPVRGHPQYLVPHGEQLYMFASPENAALFEKNPDAYLPAYDGNCAYGMVHGMKSSIDPKVYEVVDNRLFLLINHGTKKRWSKKSDKYIKKSDKAWEKLLAK